MRSVLMFVMIAALSLGAMPLAYAQPRLVTPPNATLVADSLIRLRWNPLSDASRYEVAIGWDSLFTLPPVQMRLATENTISIRRTALPYVPKELTAFWRVRARRDSMNVGGWSETWRFTMPVPKTVPPIVYNQIQDMSLLIPTGQTPTEDRIELESPQWRNDFGGINSVFINFNNVAIGASQSTISLQKGMKYSAESENQSIVAMRVKELDSTVVGGVTNPRPTLYYTLSRTSNLCQSILCTVTATDNLGWSVPCFFLLKPVAAVTGYPVPSSAGINLLTQGSAQNQYGVKVLFGQMPVTQSTIASIPILTSSTATSGWLSLSAVSGVEYALSSTGSWQPSMRVEWRSGQPKLERLWLRYTPQAIGQNFPVIRYVTNDSCNPFNHGLLRLEALGVQPTTYAYTTTSVQQKHDVETVLTAVYPNPTSNEAVFALNLSQAHHVKLTISNIFGASIQTIADEYITPGRHSIVWNSNGLPSGTYPYRLDIDGFVQSGFVSVLR